MTFTERPKCNAHKITFTFCGQLPQNSLTSALLDTPRADHMKLYAWDLFRIVPIVNLSLSDTLIVRVFEFFPVEEFGRHKHSGILGRLGRLIAMTCHQQETESYKLEPLPFDCHWRSWVTGPLIISENLSPFLCLLKDLDTSASPPDLCHQTLVLLWCFPLRIKTRPTYLKTSNRFFPINKALLFLAFIF